MKCPKCDYIGFEQAERCRNCGYDFSLSSQPASPDLTLRPEDVAAPLGDFDLGEARRPPRRTPPGRSSREDPDLDPGQTDFQAPASELPLFGSGGGDALPLLMTSTPTPPLAVRRSGPSIARGRGRATPRTVEPQPDLAFPSGEEDVAEPAGARARRARTAAGVPQAGTRAAAALLDWMLLGALDLVVVYFTLRVCHLSPLDVGRLPAAPMAAFLILLDVGYLALLTAAGGQTIGKMAFGLRVIGTDEGSVTTGRALLRTLLLLLSALPAGLGLASILLDRDQRGLHDRLADTRVVHAPAS